MKKTTGNSAALARNDELVVQDLPDEVLIYDLRSFKAHCLNGTAAFIWNHCDGQTDAAEIAKLMEMKWNTPVTEDAVWFALDKLGKADLLQERITLPQARAGMSRRSAVRRLGFGALLALPVVMSIVTPTPAAATSIPIVCQSCRKKSDGACPTPCTSSVLGTCYDNAGCGSGQAVGCCSCAACFAGTCGTTAPHLTISWEAPGVLC